MKNNNNKIDEKILLQLMKSAKLIIKPDEQDMFINDLNETISFCDTINQEE